MTRRDFDYGIGRMMPTSFSNEQCDDYDRPRGTWPSGQQVKETTNERKQGTSYADHQGQAKKTA